jgi:hypothetical protein
VTATPRQKAVPVPPQWLAQASDAPAIPEHVRLSVLGLSPHFYDPATASAAVHIAHLGMQLIEHGTQFVHEAGGEVMACGGRNTRKL